MINISIFFISVLFHFPIYFEKIKNTIKAHKYRHKKVP